MCTEEKRGWGRKHVRWNNIQKGGEMEEWEKIVEAHFFSQYQIKSKASNLVLRAQGKSQAQWSAVAGNKKQWPWAINWDQNAIRPTWPQTHICCHDVELTGVIQKGEGNSPEKSRKRGRKERLSWCSLFPLFSTRSSRQIKGALFQGEKRISKPHYCRRKLGFSHYPSVAVDTTRRTFAATPAT